MYQADVPHLKACRQDLLLSISITVIHSLVKEIQQKVIWLLERVADHIPDTMFI
jgi:hypothetical protein